MTDPKEDADASSDSVADGATADSILGCATPAETLLFITELTEKHGRRRTFIAQ